MYVIFQYGREKLSIVFISGIISFKTLYGNLVEAENKGVFILTAWVSTRRDSTVLLYIYKQLEK